MLSLFSSQSLKSCEHFSDLGVEIALSHRHVEKRWFFSGKTNQSRANSIHPTQNIRTQLTNSACFSLITPSIIKRFSWNFVNVKLYALFQKLDDLTYIVNWNYDVHQPITLILEFYYVSNGVTKLLPVLGFDLKIACAKFPINRFRIVKKST